MALHKLDKTIFDSLFATLQQYTTAEFSSWNMNPNSQGLNEIV